MSQRIIKEAETHYNITKSYDISYIIYRKHHKSYSITWEIYNKSYSTVLCRREDLIEKGGQLDECPQVRVL
jgi:hypothetical protein